MWCLRIAYSWIALDLSLDCPRGIRGLSVGSPWGISGLSVGSL